MSTVKKAVQRLLPQTSQGSPSQPGTATSTIRRGLRLEKINLVQDFFIELDEPHRSWKPGDSVTGVLILDLKKNTTEVNISLTVLGFIKLKQASTTGTVRNKPKVLFSHETQLYGAGHLSKGEHRFPFAVRLPKKNIYTSISFEKGSIEYVVRGSLNRSDPGAVASPAAAHLPSPTLAPLSRTSIQHCDKNITVVVPINITRIPKPHPKMAIVKHNDKKLNKTVSSTSTINSATTVSSDNSGDSATGSPRDKTIVLAVDLPESGYLRGELIPIKIKVQHYKPIQVSNGIIVTLIRVCRVDNGPESQIQCFRKDLCQALVPLYIDPDTSTAETSTSLRVPADVFPTISGNPLVSFRYYIEVLVNISSKNLINYNNGKTKVQQSLLFKNDYPQQLEMSRSETGMINVDKLKRFKHFLGLNTEIIIGTDRIYKSRAKRDSGSHSTAASASAASHLANSGAVSLGSTTSVALGDGELLNNSFDCDNSISESLASISPLSMDNAPHPGAAPPAPPIVHDFNLSAMSEKEILRHHEELLLPSEPPGAGSGAQTGPLPDLGIADSDHDAATSTVERSASAASDAGTTFVPAPSYSPARDAAAPAVPSQSTTATTHDNTNDTDKNDLERARLQNLESDPPEFDYVPQYNE